MSPDPRPYPFLRPALDMKGAEAKQAAKDYIDRRVKQMANGIGHNDGPTLDDADDE